MIYIIDFGSQKTIRIEKSLTHFGIVSKTIDWNLSETIDWKSTTGIILSGAPILIVETDMTPYLKRYAFLKNIKLPVLGICFGHQLLGILFGAKPFKGKEIRTETEISILLKDKLFEGFEKKVTMTEDHTEGISLPADFIHLASSENYEVEAMKHNKLPFYGVQFHPEVSGENGAKLLANFCKLITK